MVQSEFSSEGVDFTEVNDVNNGSIGFGFHREPSFSGWCDNNGTVHLEQQRKDKDVSLEEDSDFECKSAAPIFLFLSAFAFRLETPSFKLSGIIMVISIGILLTVAKETEFELFGFILVMLAAVMSGFRWCMTQILLQVLCLNFIFFYIILFLQMHYTCITNTQLHLHKHVPFFCIFTILYALNNAASCFLSWT
nr:uncharacterized protein LOC112697025 [Arachis hypogaea]